jgi:hypothetical protein
MGAETDCRFSTAGTASVRRLRSRAFLTVVSSLLGGFRDCASRGMTAFDGLGGLTPAAQGCVWRGWLIGFRDCDLLRAE